MHEYPDDLGRLRQVLQRDGLRALVAHLNQLTQHRFTSLYRFEREQLESICFYDRENPAQTSTPGVPVLASYCVFVRDSALPFQTPDSLCDPRVDGHPKRGVVRAYCGVPLVGEDGRVFGSVCHFDYEPRALTAANLELLETVATLLNEEFAAGLSGADPQLSAAGR
ncbi:MAG TPA: GAF domain-containing protein [Usitatibacter sp.]|nr:GAF domain-containing protein [Usitatibacter sp.]